MNELLFQVVRLSALPAAVVFLAAGRRCELRGARWAAAFVMLTGAWDLALTLLAGGEPIRVDLVLLLPLVTVADLVAGYLGAKRAQSIAVRVIAIGLFALGIAGVSAEVLAARHTAEVSSLLDQKRTLLFDARFRDAGSFRQAFGDVTFSADGVAGHYEPGTRQWWFSRLVVNNAGEAWVYCHYNGTELLFGRGKQSGPGVFEIRQEITEQTNVLKVWRSGSEWRATLQSPRGPDPRVNNVALRRTTPRFSGIPASAGDILGSGVYSNIQPVGTQHTRLIHVWLWYGDSEIWGCYVRTIQVHNSVARFIHPVRFSGNLRKTGSGALEFSAKAGNDDLDGLLDSGKLRLRVGYRGSPLEVATLEPQAVIDDEIFSLAPSWSRKAQDEWFRAVLTGTFVEWKVD
jgi:hypothetical protein